jgi:large subunit ribosomal protein L18
MKNKGLVLYARKREGKTNYKKRLILLKSRKPRLVIRKTNQQIIAQIVEYLPDGDKVLVATSSLALKKLGWNYSCKNIPAAYLTGLLLGKKAKDKKINEAIVDFGLQTIIPSSKIYAVVQGVKDSGIDVPVDEKVLPKKERIEGKHIISSFSKEHTGLQFSAYKKNKIEMSKLSHDMESLKKKIM